VIDGALYIGNRSRSLSRIMMSRFTSSKHFGPPAGDEMYLIAIGWMYVVLMVALVEALSSNGTVVGAVFTFLLWGVLPLSIVLYVLRTPARRRQRGRAPPDGSARHDPDSGSHPAGHAATPEREES
jgi:hypothetical protein